MKTVFIVYVVCACLTYLACWFSSTHNYVIALWDWKDRCEDLRVNKKRLIKDLPTRPRFFDVVRKQFGFYVFMFILGPLGLLVVIACIFSGDFYSE